ncbi:MAG: hypothetical protein CVV27_16565 [Candidatus Melainabacteria bacterium HGW-Melainabacteria-1]|nr:MAG: hypothetical protein CVV27_16565 [Candidatus Melainabacteria bacterium HGW-Melainabacteria-1]
MMRLSALLLLLLSLTACGRGTTDLYRAYNLTQMRDSAGKPVSDLATQNRYSMQNSGETAYYYVTPEQITAPEPEATTEAESDLDAIAAEAEELEEMVEGLVDDEYVDEEADEEYIDEESADEAYVDEEVLDEE